MAITQGHQVICCDRNRRGGLKNIWLIEQDRLDVANVSVTAGVIDSFPTLDAAGVAGAGAFQFDFDRGTGGFSANATRENGSTIVNVELDFYIPKVTSEVNQRLDELTQSCGIFAVVETYADDCGSPAQNYYFVLGYDEIFEDEGYLEFASGEQTTGIALQDANGTQVKLSGEQAEYPLELDTSSAVMTAGANFTDAWTIT